MENTPTHYPFLYPGRKKGWITETLRRIYHDRQKRNPDLTWVEPFLGGGGATLAVRPNKAILGDRYGELILVWEEIQKGLAMDPSLVNDPEVYARAKAEFNAMVPVFRRGEISPVGRSRLATLFCYLTTTCWRGVWRTNRGGEFNVIFGDRRQWQPRSPESFERYKEIVKDWKFFTSDFRDLPIKDMHNSFLYLDPPYEGTKALYGQTFQRYERAEMIRWASRFPTVVASDNPVDWVIEAYRAQGFETIIIDSSRGLASDQTPGKVAELMAFKGISKEKVFSETCLVA